MAWWASKAPRGWCPARAPCPCRPRWTRPAPSHARCATPSWRMRFWPLGAPRPAPRAAGGLAPGGAVHLVSGPPGCGRSARFRTHSEPIAQGGGAHCAHHPARSSARQRHAGQGQLFSGRAYAWHRTLLASQGGRYDPRVKSRIERGATMSAAHYIDLLHARRDWIARMEQAMKVLTPCSRPPYPSSRQPLPRWHRQTVKMRRKTLRATPSSCAPTPCCCATPAWSTCWTAAHCRCLATPLANFRWV